jgi:hypothetical protein
VRVVVVAVVRRCVDQPPPVPWVQRAHCGRHGMQHTCIMGLMALKAGARCSPLAMRTLTTSYGTPARRQNSTSARLLAATAITESAPHARSNQRRRPNFACAPSTSRGAAASCIQAHLGWLIMSTNSFWTEAHHAAAATKRAHAHAQAVVHTAKQNLAVHVHRARERGGGGGALPDHFYSVFEDSLQMVSRGARSGARALLASPRRLVRVYALHVMEDAP